MRWTEQQEEGGGAMETQDWGVVRRGVSRAHSHGKILETHFDQVNTTHSTVHFLLPV